MSKYSNTLSGKEPFPDPVGPATIKSVGRLGYFTEVVPPFCLYIIERRLAVFFLETRRLDPRRLDPRRLDPRRLDPCRLDPRRLDPRRLEFLLDLRFCDV